uniref:Protocadherin Fat 4 n=1 Tax=Magallana gigas TaxID=29159 RepID=K1PPK2_MAGGI
MRSLVTEIDMNPSDGFYNYKVEFAVKNEEATSTVICMMVYMDDNFLNEICDVPHLSTETLLFLHVFKRLNQLPEHSDKFSVWSARASVSSLVMPPPVGTLCRSGQQFVSLTNPIMKYEAVRGVTGSGDTAVASSNGFYIDDSPPVFDPEVMSAFFYYDVGQGESTPVKFQKSNDTIKCIWKCDDKESDIVENFWAIGTSPGATDIQNFTSTGQSIAGINNKLEGILEHDQTYYASFICSNGAGLNTTYIDTGGVIVKLIPPDVDSVNNTIPGTSHFTEEVYPKESLQQQDPNSVGFTFTKSEDPSVNRYDLCVGSEEETDDIIPCTWVGYNMSGSAEIKDGALWINGVEVRKLSDLKPYQDYTNTNSSASNGFTMPVGQQMFVTMRLCNKAMLCTNKSLGVVVITNSDSVVATSTNGSAIEEKLSITSRKRAAAELDIQTPSGLAAGQAIVVTKLSESDLSKDYRSDASIDFVSYIQNPATSRDMAERLLYKSLVYTPCLDCFGDEEINILLKENQSNTDIPPASSHVTINVHIQPINDPPVVFLTLNGSSLLNKDPTEDVIVLLEAINDFNSNDSRLWRARIGAFDVEQSDTLKLVLSNTIDFNLSVMEESRQVPQLFKDCNSSDGMRPTMMPCSDNFTQNLPHPAPELSWLTYIIEFTQPKNVFGNFTVGLYFEDSSNQTSLPINIKFGVMEMPCHNNGTCQATGIYPCEDTHRTHSFDAYYRCVCRGGYQGKYCTEDVNECLSDPCVPPFVCYNDLDSYRCACPSDNPHCELVLWMGVVIALIVVIILVLGAIGLYRYRKQRGPPYIEMQYKKFYQRHRKTSFKPLIPGLLGQEDFSPSNTRRNSLRNRRVAPEPILTTDAVVSAGPKDREYIEEYFNTPTDSDTPIQGTTSLKENRRGSTPSNEDLASSPGSPAPTEDTRENGVQSPVDPNLFTTRLAWKSDVDEENCEEQSEV